MKHESCKSSNTIPFRTRSGVIGPDGSVLTVANLPPANTTRWIARRKAEVVVAVQGGLLTLEQALRRYDISHDEFLEWKLHYEVEGLPGLQVSARSHPAKPPPH